MKTKVRTSTLALLSVVALTLLSTNAAAAFAAAPSPNNESFHRFIRDWTYGAAMSPTTTNYDAVEMPTNGLQFTTLPSGGAAWWWVASTTSGSSKVFAQDGFTYNGFASTTIYTGNGTTGLLAHTGGFFYEYQDPTGTCSGFCGDFIAIPSGWVHGDQVYYSIAVYTSKHELSFQIHDYQQSGTINKYKCHDSNVVGTFSGNVAGVDESGDSTLSGGNTYMHGISVWAEVISSGNRNYGSASVYTQNGPGGLQPPKADNITVSAANDYDLGWTTTGSHPTSGSVWSGSGSGSNEYVPPDGC